MILVSEIGDKTFFIAAILAMTNNKLNIFTGALSALYLMTVLSALLGWVVTTFIPREITYYTCTAIMFLFGVKVSRKGQLKCSSISFADAVGSLANEAK